VRLSLAVGIDVGAYKCAVAVCRQGEHDAERKVLNITTQRGGFAALDAWMVQQGAPIDVVVMESSGHYWFNLASHLRRQGYPVAVVNPLQAKYFAKSRLQRSKSDPADARTLAALGTHDQPRISEPLVGAELKEAARFAMRLVREQAQVCQRIQRLVDIGFPELRDVWEWPWSASSTTRSSAPTTLASGPRASQR
jgi:transposase